MATARQEIEVRGGVEERAVREVEGYIEQIEKKSELGKGQNGVQGANQVQTQVVVPQYQDMGQMVMQAVKSTGKPNITLPMSQDEVKLGLSAKMVDGVRWMAEWCVYMIKKYPGRVFYPARA